MLLETDDFVSLILTARQLSYDVAEVSYEFIF
jgi:hypothetical protein